MSRKSVGKILFASVLMIGGAALPATAQSFRVQCPTSTITHPDTTITQMVNSSEPAYTGPTTFSLGSGGYVVPSGNVNGAIKCQQISGGDGYSTMANGTQTFMFSFGPLSGLADIAAGLPGTQVPAIFNTVYGATFMPGDPANSDGWSTDPTVVASRSLSGFTFNGAVGLTPDSDCIAANAATPAGTAASQLPCPNLPTGGLDGHVDPRQIMDIGVMNGNIPAPLMAIDEDDEYFLTLSNVGMIMRPDLFEQHTVHFHGYPNASSVYDGVPDASVAINIGASFTYYYLAPDAGTYFWHCHITPPEHLQMGMVGQLYVRPRQNRVTVGTSLYASLQQQELDKRTACISAADILCSNPLPAVNTGALRAASGNYAYNDGDGSSYYDVEYPLQ